MVNDQQLSEVIRASIQSYPDVREIKSILIYTTEDKLRINVRCVFAQEESIAATHQMVSKIEEAVRRKFENAVVTIRAEPVSNYVE